jgi:hypothetical protein
VLIALKASNMFAIIFLIFILSLPPALVFLFADWINTNFSQREGVITALVGVGEFYFLVLTFYYFKNERFNLWVHRQVLRFRKTHTAWQINSRFTGVTLHQNGEK